LGTLKLPSLVFLQIRWGKEVILWIVYDTLERRRYAGTVFLALVSSSSDEKCRFEDR
jgi:hypothetical protein